MQCHHKATFALLLLLLTSGGSTGAAGPGHAAGGAAHKLHLEADQQSGLDTPWPQRYQEEGSPADKTWDQRPVVPLTGASDRPTGYLMKRRSPDTLQTYRETGRTEYHVTLLFNGRCSVVSQAGVKAVTRSLRRMIRHAHNKLAYNARIVSFSCIHQLRLVLSLPLIRGERVLYAELMLFRGRNFTIVGEEFAFHSFLSDKNNPIIEKPDPHDSSQKFIFFGLLLVGLCVLLVILSMVMAECFFCLRRLILPPPLLDLARYSEDEVPRCMKDDLKKRGKVSKVANVYAVPGFLHTIHGGGDKPISSQNNTAPTGPGNERGVPSDDEMSSEWSTEVEYPRYQDHAPVYASAKRPISGEKTSTHEEKQISTQSETIKTGDKNADVDEDVEKMCVPLFQCQTLNPDYEPVANDSDDGSESSVTEESYFLTHVSSGHDGRLQLETDM